jgi:hypothetical protein
MRRVFRRPSPAMVVAIVALISALGGTAVGAAFVTKKQAKKIAKNQVNKLAPKLSVASAKSADNANNLDGKDSTAFVDTCPSNAPTNISGICVSGAQGPSNWDVANQGICRPQGLRAPTIGEALVIMTRLASGETWTDEVTHADGATQTRGLVTAPGDPQGQIFAAPVGSSHTVRCVINATNPTS